MNGKCRTILAAALVLLVTAGLVVAQADPERPKKPKAKSDRPAAQNKKVQKKDAKLQNPTWQPPVQGRGQVLLAVLRRLNLSDQQRQQIRGILQGSRQQIQGANQAMADARAELQKAVVDGAGEAAIRQAAADLGAAIGNQAVARSTVMNSIKQVLTPEQIQKVERFQSRAGAFLGQGRGPGAGAGAGAGLGLGPGGRGFGPGPAAGRGPDAGGFGPSRRGGPAWQQGGAWPNTPQSMGPGMGAQNRLRLRNWNW